MSKFNITETHDLFKSRNILLEILEDRGFDVSNYNNPSFQEFNSMLTNDQLDIFVQKPPQNQKDEPAKIYVKYILSGKINVKMIWSIAEELFDQDEILNREKDELIVVSMSNVNSSNIKLIEDVYNSGDIFMNILHYRETLFNKLKHELVPKHIVISDKQEIDAIKKKYNIVRDDQFPDISRHEPIARLIGLRPGNLCKIERYSVSAGKIDYYRMCS